MTFLSLGKSAKQGEVFNQ